MDFITLRNHFRGKISILCHHNADPDAIGAAYALQRLIKILDPESTTEILYPDSASQLSNKIISHFNIVASTSPKIVKADTIIVVDTGSIAQLETLAPLLKGVGVKIFIDHHSKNAEIEKIASIYIEDEEAVAACELVYDLWVSFGLEPPQDVAENLLLGIAFDSKHFQIGTPQTFRTVAKLLELGASLRSIRYLLSTQMEKSEKIARLKATQRMTIVKVDPWIIATSNLGSFQPSAARGMLGLGADVAAIAGNDKKKLKASIRSTEFFYQKTGIHLANDISNSLAEKYVGAGGGHKTAAGVNGQGDAKEFLIDFMELLTEKLEKHKIG
jgi:phosphoesterase RecJ-like protein